MSANGWFQFAVFSVILLASVRPVGIYLARVLEGERTWLDPVLRPIERLIYKLCGVDADKEMNWREYAYAVLGISAVSLVVTYGFERLQHLLPWNPQGLANVGPDLAWNTAASFTTNTNWQSYTPETTMSYLTQMAGLAYHNFLSAAMGIAVAVALIRAIKRTSSGTIGNFWVDTTRTLLYVLLPASIIGALLLVAQGVPQNLHAYTTAHTLEQPGQTQTIAQGPRGLAGSHQGNGHQRRRILQRQQRPSLREPHAAHQPLRNVPDLLIGAGLTYTLGRMTGSPGHGWAVLAAMFVLFSAGFTTVYWAESHPHLLIHGAAQTGTATAPAGNMEGKEVRFGVSSPRSSPTSPPTPVAARSTPCTTRSLRWAAWWCSSTS
jgi:K+-transporting ATPase ATPase A chain